MHDFLTICAPAPLQEAAITALQLPESFYVQLVAGYTERRAKMMAILEEVGFRALYPEGAYYVMADYSGINPSMDDITFAKWLTSEKRVAVVPGSSFYKSNPALGHGMVRFAFPKQISTLEQAGRRMLS
jgi:aminotransferase